MQASRLTAIGGVLLAGAVLLIEDRMRHTWSRGAHLGVAAGVFALLYLLAIMSTREEGPRPTAAQSALLVSSYVSLIAAVIRLGQVANDTGSPDDSGTVLWMALIVGVIAAYATRRLGSAISTLVAALAFGTALVEFCHKFLGVDQVAGFRVLFLVIALLYAVAAARLRAQRPDHAAQLVNSLALVSIAILGTITFGISFDDEGVDSQPPSLPTGWELVALGLPLIAIAYGLFSRKRGPAWSGSLTLAFAILVIDQPGAIFGSGAHQHETLVGWPLVFLIAGGVALVAGMAQPRRT